MYLLDTDWMIQALAKHSYSNWRHGKMSKNMTPVKVTAESDLLRLLDEVEENSPVLLERRGVFYRLSIADESDIACEPDPEAVRRMLDEVAGSWADLDIDEVIKYVYEGRKAGSRSPYRP